MHVNAFILWTTTYDRTVAFYRALGVPLVDEQHDDGPVHAACELGEMHFAVYAAAGAAAIGYRTGGGAMLGVVVASIDPILAALAPPIVSAPEVMPWGRRVVIADPDGRAVELTES